MIASPCNQICTLDPATGWCRGCGRTITEIAEWGSASEERQRAILAALQERLHHLRGDRGGGACNPKHGG